MDITDSNNNKKGSCKTGEAKNVKELLDKFGNKFKVIRRDNLTIIFNYERIVKENPEKYYEIGVNALRYDK